VADHQALASAFEEHRAHLRGVAYRVLGSVSDADDAVQETWLRLSRADVSGILNLRAWLTTVTGRVALTMLQSRAARREDIGADIPEPSASGSAEGRSAALAGYGPSSARDGSPEDAALLGDDVSAALQVVLGTLEPRERLAFVLHDLFAVPFDEIAPVTGTTSVAARQLASRARRRVRSGAPEPVAASLDANAAAQRAVVEAFFAAAREAQFAALLELLDPDVVMRADAAAARMGAEDVLTGVDALARWMSGRARGAVPALVGGEPGAAWVVGGRVRVAFGFTITPAGRIAAIDLIGDPAALRELHVEACG
jgi:RNA polymerase sigma factor (sigma-70 family)